MRSKGFAYEQLAAQYLKQKGLKLINQNYHSRYGEIDLIMTDRKTLTFIEVRYRKNSSYGTPAETITRHKQKKIITTARHFLSSQNLWHYSCRFDVISINTPTNNSHPEIVWLQGAFDGE
jgi:putative endonuclease